VKNVGRFNLLPVFSLIASICQLSINYDLKVAKKLFDFCEIFHGLRNHNCSEVNGEFSGNIVRHFSLFSLTRLRPSARILKVTKLRVVKGIFVIRDRPLFFPVKCEMAIFFPVNRDFYSSREPWFSKINFREMRNRCLFRREPWFLLCFLLFLTSVIT